MHKIVGSKEESKVSGFLVFTHTPTTLDSSLDPNSIFSVTTKGFTNGTGIMMKAMYKIGSILFKSRLLELQFSYQLLDSIAD